MSLAPTSDANNSYHGTLTVPINNDPDYEASLVLLPEGAAFEPASCTLLVADVHLGKAETFRRLGVPVPGATSGAGLARLTQLLNKWQPDRLVFLGDLIHDQLAPQHGLFADLAGWRGTHRAIQMCLVLGNHDRKAGALPAACAIDVLEPGTRLGPLCLQHEPYSPAPGFGHAVAGHIHPVVRVRGRVDSIRVPCFWGQADLTVLPAFGAFTGGWAITPGTEDSVFVLDGVSVLRLPSATQRSRSTVR